MEKRKGRRGVGDRRRVFGEGRARRRSGEVGKEEYTNEGAFDDMRE